MRIILYDKLSNKLHPHIYNDVKTENAKVVAYGTVMIISNENAIKFPNDLNSTKSFNLVGGVQKQCDILSRVGQSIEPSFTLSLGEDSVNLAYEIGKIINVGESRSYIDDSKLIISLYINRTKYETHEELFHIIRNWWVDTMGRSESTVIDRIRHARSMQNHAVYPVD